MTDRPSTILVSPSIAAAMRAALKFAGRDRRRIKREINKALRSPNPPGTP